MTTSARVGIALAALVCTHAATLYYRAETIESDLHRPARAALDNRGLNQVTVTLHGRDMTLSGVVTDRKTADQAIALARSSSYGIRIVNDEMRLESL